MIRRLTLLALCLASLACAAAQIDAAALDCYRVVPLPHSIRAGQGGAFVLDSTVMIRYDDRVAGMERNAGFLSEYIGELLGFTPIVRPMSMRDFHPQTRRHDIVLALSDSVTASEGGYRIMVNDHVVFIAGATPQGVFYGVQTLRKTVARVVSRPVTLPSVVIDDAPAYGYRGMHLDCSRHFFDVDFVKKYIDLLAMHNMNVFHWHLSDDQGWRLEIKKYPRLTQVGSQRSGTVVGHNVGIYDNTPYGGYYTQAEALDIVDYARERFITVIPEIDMPGHMLAALASYPELGCTGGPYQVWRSWGVSPDVLCLGNDRTLQFCEDVLSEVMEIFPSPYIHIGGDETPRDRWKACPRDQAAMARLGIDVNNYQAHFTTEIERFINRHGRKIIGWDEILEGDINPSATVMYWRGWLGDEGIRRAARSGHDVVLVPNNYLYFDYYQVPETDDRRYIYSEPLLIGPGATMEQIYGMRTLADELDPESRSHVLGMQANIWTEYIYCPELVEYQALPRMAALAEVQWNMERNDYPGFLSRLTGMRHLYQLHNYRFHPW